MLPNTAAFHDPFYSTGNAFTLTGISRLMQMLERSWNQSRWSDEMEEYDRMIQRETEFIDLLVSGSFDGFCDFERMVAQSMFYFAASIWSETERRAGRTAPGAAFLCADREDVWKALTRAASEIGDPSVSTSRFVDNVRQGIKPINRAGLCDPAKHNLYGFQ